MLPRNLTPPKVEILELDRTAAIALRETLADLCGFWFRTDDDGPLCQALARHRIETEQHLTMKLAPLSRLGRSDVTLKGRVSYLVPCPKPDTIPTQKS